MALLAILLVAAAVRVPVVLRVPMWWDEVWSMWQTQGDLGQTIAITPYDWPPLYFVVLRAWTAVAGHGDVSGRMLSVLFALGTVAILYGAGRAVAGEWAGRFAALMFAVLPYPAYLSLEARGYSLLLLLTSLLVWVHVEWLRKPSGARTVLYAVLSAACIYTSYIGILVVALVLAHAVAATAWAPAGDRARHLASVTVVSGLILLLLVPMVTSLGAIARLKWRHIVEQTIRPPGFDELLPSYARWVAGDQPLLMGALVILAVAGWVRWCRARPGRDETRLMALLVVWAIGVPIAMHLLRHLMHLVSVRYVVYAVVGLILALAAGLARLPAAGRWLAGAAMLGYALLPLPVELYRPRYSDEKPTREAVRAMARNYRPGDVVLLDPGCRCGRSVEWAYWEGLYYPGGRAVRITDPGSAGRRVWYWADHRTIDQTLRATLARGRLRTDSFGEPYMHGELFEAPPHAEGTLVGDRVRFHGSDFESTAPYRPGDTLRVRLWWSVTSTPEDLAFELTVRAPGGEQIAGVTASPEGALAPARTSSWRPGQLYSDRREIRLPRRLHAGSYSIHLVVVPASDPRAAVRVPLGAVEVFSYN